MSAPAPDPGKALLERWNLLLAAAGPLVGSLTGMVLRPPRPIFTPDPVRLVVLLVAVGLVPVYLTTPRYTRRRHVRGWLVGAAAAGVLAVGLLLAYGGYRDAHCCEYRGVTVVTGELTTQAARIMAAAPEKPCQELLADFGGQERDVWTEASVRRTRMVMEGLFTLCLVALTGMVVMVVQALYCRSRK